MSDHENSNSDMSYAARGLSISGVSPDIANLARMNHSNLLRISAEIGLETIANRLMVNQSTVSRMKETDMDRWAKISAAMGVIVPSRHQAVYDIDYVKSLERLAHETLSKKISGES